LSTNEENADIVRFALVGCGNIGEKYLEVIHNNPRAQMVAVVDEQPLENLKNFVGNLPYFRSLEDFFNSDIQADVVTIATPNYLHAKQSISCLEKGFHVVIEKPLALKLKDALAVQKVEKKTGKKVFVVLQNRYSELSQWAKNLVDSGILGKIFMVQINCFWNRDERYYLTSNWKGDLEKDGGSLFTQYSHFLDIMYWLFGDIQNIKGDFFDFSHQHITDFEDSGIITFDFVNGGSGVFNFSTAAWDQNMESSLTILAENGAVKIAGQYMQRLEYCHIKNYKCPKIEEKNAFNDYGNYCGSASNHSYLIDNVIDVLKNNAEISVSSQCGVDLVRVIERIYTFRKDLIKIKQGKLTREEMDF